MHLAVSSNCLLRLTFEAFATAHSPEAGSCFTQVERSIRWVCYSLTVGEDDLNSKDAAVLTVGLALVGEVALLIVLGVGSLQLGHVVCEPIHSIER